jgi:hypothetical protein
MKRLEVKLHLGRQSRLGMKFPSEEPMGKQKLLALLL